MKALALLALFTAGCATTQPPVITKTDVVEVKVPVAVRCIDEKDIPPKTGTVMKPKDDVGQKAAGAAIDIHNLELENAQLRARLEGCAK